MKRLISHISAPAPRYMLRLSVLDSIFRQEIIKEGFTVMELGPGLGDICSFFNEVPECARVSAVDFSQETIALLKERFKGKENKVHCYAKSLLEIEESADIFLAFEVLEHIEDDGAAVKHIFSKLNSAGRFILSVPAYSKKWQRADIYAGHYRRYEKQQLHQLLADAGFENIKIIDYGFPLMMLLYPFRQMAYCQRGQQGQLKGNKGNSRADTQIEKTKRSGINRPFFNKIPASLMWVLYMPFLFIQRWFAKYSLGDGLVATAEKK